MIHKILYSILTIIIIALLLLNTINIFRIKNYEIEISNLQHSIAVLVDVKGTSSSARDTATANTDEILEDIGSRLDKLTDGFFDTETED